MTACFESRTESPLPATPWWHRLHADSDACVRLWCFPIAGAGAAVWHPWTAPLAGAAEILSICLPGREYRLGEAPLTRMEEAVSALSAAMGPYVGERDVFCGHGMGGLLAFELARRLRAERKPGPRALVLAGVAAPWRRRKFSPLHGLSPRPFLAAVEHRYGPIPAELRDQPDILDLLLPALRADLELEEMYAASLEPKLELPVLALTGTRDPLVAWTEALAWKSCTTGPFEIALVTGGHFFVTENPIPTATRVRRFLATL